MAMTITITPEILYTLCNSKFTFSACEAICEIFEESPASPYIGDIYVSFYEYPTDQITDEIREEHFVIDLDNGNSLIEN